MFFCCLETPKESSALWSMYTRRSCSFYQGALPSDCDIREDLVVYTTVLRPLIAIYKILQFVLGSSTLRLRYTRRSCRLYYGAPPSNCYIQDLVVCTRELNPLIGIYKKIVLLHLLVATFEYKYLWRDRHIRYWKFNGRQNRERCKQYFHHLK